MTPDADPLSPQHWPDSLHRAFSSLSRPSWMVALSGGLDSVLLLHLALAWQQQQGHPAHLQALHVNHGLQSQSNSWARFCEDLCQRLEVPLVTVPVVVEGDSPAGLEDAARVARYQAFRQQLEQEQLLLLGHHADDQAETQLYRMMRGAGLSGFAAIPPSRALGRGALARPLLEQSRQMLERWALAAGLEWVEDPSNQEDRYDRNFLRNRVLPLLRDRWPGVSQRMARNAAHGREAMGLLDDLAAEDARRLVERDSGDLLLEPLRALSGPRQRNLVQWWLRGRGLTPLNEVQLTTALPEFLGAVEDGQPELVWDGLVLRRYNGRVLVLDQAVLEHGQAPGRWTPPDELGWAGGLLSAQPVTGEGLARRGEPFEVRPRQGGERLVLAGGQHQPLKKWLQGQRIAPWERAALPLVWCGATLVAVGDLWLHPHFQARPGQPGWRIRWSPPPFRAGRAVRPES